MAMNSPPPMNSQQQGYNFGNRDPPLMQGGGQPGGSYGPQGGGGGYVPQGPQGGGYGPQGGGYGVPGGSPGNAGKAMAMASSNHMNDVFFGAAICIVAMASIGGTCMFFSFKTVEFLQTTYFLIFGLVLAVLDTPVFKAIKAVIDAKLYVGKYVNFITRVTGKGVTLIFLGCALFMNMWDNLEGGVLRFLAVVLCLFPAHVGLASVVIGVLKSSKLDKARRALQLVVDQRYDHFAQTYPGPTGGLTMDEFNMLTMENGGFKFETLDLKLIFNALITNPLWRGQAASNAQQRSGYAPAVDEIKLPKQDLMEWCKYGFVFL